MQSIIEELYYGNIQPDVMFYGQDSPFVKASHLKHRNMEALMGTLEDSEKELFEKYCDAQADIEKITKYDTFTYALKFGILLMAEIFMGKGEIFSDKGEGNHG